MVPGPSGSIEIAGAQSSFELRAINGVGEVSRQLTLQAPGAPPPPSPTGTATLVPAPTPTLAPAGGLAPAPRPPAIVLLTATRTPVAPGDHGRASTADGQSDAHCAHASADSHRDAHARAGHRQPDAHSGADRHADANRDPDANGHAHAHTRRADTDGRAAGTPTRRPTVAPPPATPTPTLGEEPSTTMPEEVAAPAQR